MLLASTVSPLNAMALLIASLGLANLVAGLKILSPHLPAVIKMITNHQTFKWPPGLLTALAGMLVLIMSVGLGLRSRLAWAISLLLIAGTLALSLHQHWLHWSSMVYFNAIILFCHDVRTVGSRDTVPRDDPCG